jgi:tyrosinase
MALRKEASTLTAAESGRYKNAITQMLADPTNPYGKLVAIHGNMAHHQHGGMGAAGTQRFLPWHRAFLIHFERALQQIDAQAFVPYWDWTKHKSVPTWLKTFKPQVFIPGYGTVKVKRMASIPAKKNVTAIMALPAYTTFTDHLENGPHGEVHMELGVVAGHNEAMANIRISPADPIFWLHHAQIDRLWSVWEAAHPGLGPTLSGSNSVMDPWTETVTQLLSIQSLGYSYP